MRRSCRPRRKQPQCRSPRRLRPVNASHSSHRQFVCELPLGNEQRAQDITRAQAACFWRSTIVARFRAPSTDEVARKLCKRRSEVVLNVCNEGPLSKQRHGTFELCSGSRRTNTTTMRTGRTMPIMTRPAANMRHVIFRLKFRFFQGTCLAPSTSHNLVCNGLLLFSADFVAGAGEGPEFSPPPKLPSLTPH